MCIRDRLRNADVVTIADSRLKPLYFKDEWIKKGATVLVTGPVHTDESFWLSSKIVYDNTKLHEAYMQEAAESGNKKNYYAGVIGGPLYTCLLYTSRCV